MHTRPGITLTKIWSDDDMVELRVDVSNGRSLFSNEIYVGHEHLTEMVAGLDKFKSHVHGGIFDIELGEFGPEYASGACHVRLHFQERGLLYLTVRSQTDFSDFGKKNVASEATLYLKAEPALLDNFIQNLRALSKGKEESAALEAI